MAKRIIQLVTLWEPRSTMTPEIGDLLKVYFVPDYNVSLAEVLIPGSRAEPADQHSGHRGLRHGQHEVRNERKPHHRDHGRCQRGDRRGDRGRRTCSSSACGLRTCPACRTERRNFKPDPRFEYVVSMIRKNVFGWSDFFDPLCDSITVNGDYYLLANDFPSYIEAQAKVEATYKDPDKWVRMSILSTAGSGFFSSDRTIKEYADQIWGVKPCAVPDDDLQTTALYDRNGANEIPTAA
eukprot:jgi/Botrbrau1/8661/Bobra.0087s0015.1